MQRIFGEEKTKGLSKGKTWNIRVCVDEISVLVGLGVLSEIPEICSGCVAQNAARLYRYPNMKPSVERIIIWTSWKSWVGNFQAMKPKQQRENPWALVLLINGKPQKATTCKAKFWRCIFLPAGYKTWIMDKHKIRGQKSQPHRKKSPAKKWETRQTPPPQVKCLVNQPICL